MFFFLSYLYYLLCSIIPGTLLATFHGFGQAQGAKKNQRRRRKGHKKRGKEGKKGIILIIFLYIYI